MHPLKKALFLVALLPIVAMAKNYFVSHGDICEEAVDHYCTNDSEAILNLQIAFTADRKLKIKNLFVDGIWGEGTKNAIIAFQAYYKIEPADGWAGKSTREKLDKVYKSKKFSFAANEDMCEEAEGQECPNNYEEVRNLQIVLNADKNLTRKILYSNELMKKVAGDKINLDGNMTYLEKKQAIKLDVDGIWGAKTMAAVEIFQELYGQVQVDGWVGPATKRLLNEVSKGMVFPEVPKRYRKVQSTKGPVRTGSYRAFVRSKRYPRTLSTFSDKKLLKLARKNNTKIIIDISEQRIKLYVGGKVAIDSPCTTGAKRKLEPNTRRIYNKSTPKGKFRITEKIADKRSTIFGKLYRGGKLVWRGDRRKYRGPKAKYIGASLRNWMRLTSSGIGIHGSKYIKRYPATNGCIRVPYRVVSNIFRLVKKGTTVSIIP